MNSRSAYARLGYSPLTLMIAVLGMIVAYAAPPLMAIFATGAARIAALLVWLMMAFAFWPMLRFYRLPPVWAFALPAIGSLYTLFTINSALQFWRGRGGMWKGRAQAMA